ncbi:hypothetical protein EVAR_66072_1 [Eumeta japonica]|uniref:Uncharacterized protein n=1 Tax=Eumeta variegata TaxID=151549 RepID=A0A4C2A5A3_EUMVA|nr:hypothetical protein EVAR_66072_1 [Eumeta japonica]
MRACKLRLRSRWAASPASTGFCAGYLEVFARKRISAARNPCSSSCKCKSPRKAVAARAARAPAPLNEEPLRRDAGFAAASPWTIQKLLRADF